MSSLLPEEAKAAAGATVQVHGLRSDAVMTLTGASRVRPAWKIFDPGNSTYWSGISYSSLARSLILNCPAIGKPYVSPWYPWKSNSPASKVIPMELLLLDAAGVSACDPK